MEFTKSHKCGVGRDPDDVSLVGVCVGGSHVENI